jgi:rod shape-determining protein MreD
VRTAGIILAVALAVALQTTLARFFVRGAVAVDLVVVAVVYVALVAGPVTGLLAGAAAGLAQDMLVGTMVGVGGLAKTVIGFVAGSIGTQFIVAQPLSRFVVFFVATVAHAVVFMGLYAVLNLRQFGPPYAAVLGQAVGNAVIGVVAFQLAELLPGVIERRRFGRGRRRR